MNKREAEQVARGAKLYEFQPNDCVMGPRGHVMYQEPGLVMPGWHAFGFMLQGKPVGVLIVRPGQPVTLRYFDREGQIRDEKFPADSPEAGMVGAIARMSDLIKNYLGQRHPLADLAAANARPA